MFNKSFLKLESLEERMMLSGSGTDLPSVQSSWSNFDITADCNVIDIDAGSLTAQSLQTALATAATTAEDDLILIHTTSNACSIEFTTAKDELVIDINSVSFGKISILSVGEQMLTIDAKENSRIFCVKNGYVQLGNMILTGGLAKTDMEGNLALSGLGGAVANSATLILDKVTIDGNRADHGKEDGTYSGFNSQGGGIYNAGNMKIFNTTIKNNVAFSGEINEREKAAFGAGGGIFNHVDGTLLVKNTIISHNEAESNILKNIPDPPPQGVFVIVSVEQNGQGGGVCNFGSLTISDNSVISNNSAMFGGGISCLYIMIPSSVTLSDSQITGNDAHDSGGGIYTAPCCSVVIERSFIQGNTAEVNGGGITNQGELSLINSVLSGNSAGTNGGGLYSYGTYNSSVPVYLVNIASSTITGNSSGTIKNGVGGGLYFAGMELGNSFATLEIGNSLIVNNRVVLPKDTTSDVNIYKIGLCSGNHSLTTFSDWSNQNVINYRYDETVPLFTTDYDFTTKTEGDYRLVYDSQSQAIDTGNNETAASAGLNSNSLDLSGLPRIQSNTIDLGAYEYRPTPFDQAFPTCLSVQQGCSFNLQCEGTDKNKNPIVKYYVDLDGDGNFDREGNDLWIAWRELSNRGNNKGYFWLTIENSLGTKSESKKISVNIIEVLPNVHVQQSKFYNDQIINLCITVLCYDRSIQQWTINWGDGTTPTQYTSLSNSLDTVHYYVQKEETRTCHITLNLIDSNGNGGNITYYLNSNTIPAINTPIQTNENTEDETQTIYFATEDWYDAEKTDSASSSNLCWAGSTANILYYTGWASGEITDKDLVAYTFESEDDVMNYLVNHFTNGSGSVYYAVDWFLTGNYNAPTSSGWAQNDVSGGGFYNNTNIYDVRKYYSCNDSNEPETILPEVAELLVDGYGVGMSFGAYRSNPNETLLNGHAVTLWGYTADPNYNSTDPEYYTSLKITDSDDDKYSGQSAPNNLITVDIKWNSDYQKYQVLNYGSGSRTYWIEEFFAIAPKTDSPLLNIANSNTTNSVDPLLAALLDQKGDWEPLTDNNRMKPVKIESMTGVSALESQYQPTAAAGLNNASARIAVLESLWNDDMDLSEGIDGMLNHNIYSLETSLESDLFGKEDLDDLFISCWR